MNTTQEKENQHETNPPALDHDARMLERFGRRVSPRGRQERRIVAALIEHLDRAGFKPASVDWGEEPEAAGEAKAVMELVFNVDEAWVIFNKPAGAKHGVFLVQGNGEDIISDWTFSRSDADGFDAAMKAFDPQEVA